MSYPKPLFRETIDIGRLQIEEGRSLNAHPESFRNAREALERYFRDNTYVFHSSSEGPDRTYKKTSGLTHDGIVVHMRGNYTIEPIDLDV